MLDGEGVRARGLSGTLCTDFRRWVDAFTDGAFFGLVTCSELGRPRAGDGAAAAMDTAAGELGTLEDGELLGELTAGEESGDHGTGGERTERRRAGLPSHVDADLLRQLKPDREVRAMCVPCTARGSTFPRLRRRSRCLWPLFLSPALSFAWRFLMALRAILPAAEPLGRVPVWMEVLCSGTQRTFSTEQEDSRCTTCVCSKLCTDSSLMWVSRSPGLRPASWAGLLADTSWKPRDTL